MAVNKIFDSFDEAVADVPDSSVMLIGGFGPVATSEEEDFNLANASGQFVSRQPGMSFFDHAESFAMIRGEHINLCVLGGLQVSRKAT